MNKDRNRELKKNIMALLDCKRDKVHVFQRGNTIIVESAEAYKLPHRWEMFAFFIAGGSL